MTAYVEIQLSLTEDNNPLYEAYAQIKVYSLGGFDQIIPDDENKEYIYTIAEEATGWSRDTGLTIFLGTQLSDETLIELFQWINDEKTELLIEDGGTLPENRVHVFAVKDYEEAVRFKLKWIGDSARYTSF